MESDSVPFRIVSVHTCASQQTRVGKTSRKSKNALSSGISSTKCKSAMFPRFLLRLTIAPAPGLLLTTRDQRHGVKCSNFIRAHFQGADKKYMALIKFIGSDGGLQQFTLHRHIFHGPPNSDCVANSPCKCLGLCACLTNALAKY